VAEGAEFLKLLELGEKPHINPLWLLFEDFEPALRDPADTVPWGIKEPRFLHVGSGPPDPIIEYWLLPAGKQFPSFFICQLEVLGKAFDGFLGVVFYAIRVEL
jgi:hypothetical protein